MKDFMANAINKETVKLADWPFMPKQDVVTKLSTWDYPGIFGYEKETPEEQCIREELAKRTKIWRADVGFEKRQAAKYIKDQANPEVMKDTNSIEKDPSGKPLNTAGAKADAGKPRPWLMFRGFSRALEEVSKVTSIGATKYTPDGWATVENAEDRYMDAFMRHLFPVARGHKLDDGQGGIGTLHLAQVIWNLLAVLELELRDKECPSKK